MSLLVFLPGNILGKDLALRNPVSLGCVTVLCLEASSYPPQCLQSNSSRPYTSPFTA